MGTDSSDTDEEYRFDQKIEKSESKKKRSKLEAADSLSESPRFNSFIGLAVLLNIFLMGIENDLGVTDPSVCMSAVEAVKSRLGWFILDSMFIAIFLVEMLIRMAAERVWFFRLRSGGLWNWLDLFLVSVGVIDTWILSLMNPCGRSTQLRALLALRVVRTFRLIRVTKLLRSFRELWLIVSGLADSLRTLIWVAVLLVGVLYVSAIFVTGQIGKSNSFDVPSYDGTIWAYNTYFGTVPKSMLTLWQIATLDSWADSIVRHVVYQQPFMILFFAGFILLTTFGIFNIIVGVIVENTMGIASAQRREQASQIKDKERRAAIDSLKRVFELSDADRSGTLSRAEFSAAVKLREVQEKLEYLDIEPQEAEELFDLIDAAGKDQITLNDFVNACMQMIGGANQRDIMQVSLVIEGLAKKVEHLGKRIEEVEDSLKDIDGLTKEFIDGPLVHLTGNRIEQS